MKRTLLFVLALLVAASGGLLAQSSNQARPVTETMYIKPKRNMDDKLEAGLKAHNEKFHPDGPYRAAIRKVNYGAKEGWYVWLMGPTDYASLDSRPDKGAHDEDWNKNVDPYIEEYGSTSLFEFDDKYSFGREIMIQSGHYDAWSVTVKPGQMDQFNQLIMSMKKTFESMGNRSFLTYRNMVHTRGGADVALLFSYTNMADWGSDWKLKDAYEKLYGPGSWQLMFKTWDTCVEDYDEELRSFVK